MLIEFRVKNHRSIREEQVLTMQASVLGDKADDRPRHVSGFSESLLPAAVIYGANASGKSNVLSALAYMRNAVQESHRSWAPKQGVPRNPFGWGQSKSKPSVFEVTIIHQEVKYDYGFAISPHEVLEEWLFAWPMGRRQMWFEREKQSFQFGDHLKGENKTIVGITRDNSLFLSAAAQNNHPQLTPIFDWFSKLRSINVSTRETPFGASFESQFVLAATLDAESKRCPEGNALEEDKGIRPLTSTCLHFLRTADIGIVDLRVDAIESDEPIWTRNPRIHLKHQSKSDEAWLPLSEESNGTRTLFHMLIPLMQTLTEGGILLIDELEASLHPSMAQQIVRQFNSSVANPYNAQLIFTTHDTNLLGTTVGEPVLRRDQVWFTEKDNEGATVLYPLTDYKPRKAENLERGYLQGRYGAIPFLGEFSIAAE